MADYISKFQYNGTTWDMKDAEARQSLASCVNNGYYDSNAKKIILRHDSTTIVQIDATDFIKDGMVSNVQVVNGYLVITFNTDAGQEPIRIPITDIFNPDNYYTKSATNGLLALKQDIIQDIAQIRQGANAGSTAYQKPQGGIPLSDINTNDIDGAPTHNSNKLVRSGGVQNELALGAVYDVSAHNNSATFASLSALLNAANIDTLIPTSVRKGGMSIKFVLTSDNRYVQYRLLTKEFSVNVDDWECTASVENLENSLSVVAEALLYLYSENKALRELLAGKDNAVLPVVKAQSVECDDILTMGVPNVLYSSEEGAPSAVNVPDNWNEETMTTWNGCPRKIGQQYVDKVSGKVYYAVDVTGSTNDWVALN